MPGFAVNQDEDDQEDDISGITESIASVSLEEKKANIGNGMAKRRADLAEMKANGNSPQDLYETQATDLQFVLDLLLQLMRE